MRYIFYIIVAVLTIVSTCLMPQKTNIIIGSAICFAALLAVFKMTVEFWELVLSPETSTFKKIFFSCCLLIFAVGVVTTPQFLLSSLYYWTIRGKYGNIITNKFNNSQYAKFILMILLLSGILTVIILGIIKSSVS